MYNNLNQHLLLFADCIISEGYLNNIIFDLTREQNSSFIPASYVNFINKCKDYTLNEIFSFHENESNILDEYVKFTLDNEYGFLCDRILVNSFPPISENLNSPEYIDNCILELSNFEVVYLKKINFIFDQLIVNSVEIRIKLIEYSELIILLESFNSSSVESISLYVNEFKGEVILNKLNELLKKHFRIKKVIICNSFENQLNTDSIIKFSKDSLSILVNKAFSPSNIINISYFIESQKVNPYYYKKMIIDYEGNIKNLDKCFGRVDEIKSKNDILNIVQSLSFQSLWRVSKNNIQVCLDCEYKSVCFDTRKPYKENNSNKYYFKEECIYNPYIGKTKGEEGYLTLEESGVISNENGYSINHEKIAKIHAFLWIEEEIKTE